MPDPLRKVRPGEPFVPNSAFHNSVVDLLAPDLTTSSGTLTYTRSQTVVTVRNDSGEDRDQFDALLIVAPVILPSENEPHFNERVVLACEDQSGATLGRWVVLAEPIAAGAYGRAWIAGVVPANVFIADAASALLDQPVVRAELIAGHELSLAAKGAAQVLWLDAEPETGTRRAVVRLSNHPGVPPVELVELVDDLYEGGSANGYVVDRLTLWAPRTPTVVVRSFLVDGDTPLNGVTPPSPFRGACFGHGVSSGRSRVRGDVVAAVRMDDGQYLAISQGRTSLRGRPQNDAVVGAFVWCDIRLWDLDSLPESDPGEWTLQAEVFGADATEGVEYEIVWDSAEKHFIVIVAASGEEEVACGLERVTDPEDPDVGKLRVNPADLAGDGLERPDPETCELAVKAGCGLEIDEEGAVAVKPADLAGKCLDAGTGCKLDVDISCIVEELLSNETFIDTLITLIAPILCNICAGDTAGIGGGIGGGIEHVGEPGIGGGIGGGIEHVGEPGIGGGIGGGVPGT